MPKFVKGQSGNPRGRPPGVVTQKKLRDSISKDISGILVAMKERALAGDTQAAKLLLDRALPALKPTETPIELALDGTPTEAARAVLSALGVARITPEQASKLLAGIGTLARVIEIDELTARIDALEGKTWSH